MSLLTSLFILLAISATLADAAPTLTEPYPYSQRLAVETRTGEIARVVENCGVTSSRTGGFAIPRRTGPHLFGLLCEEENGDMRLRVFASADLSLLLDHKAGVGLAIRLLPQGLQVSEGDNSFIWEAPDGDFGSARFLAANGESSGLRFSPGEPLAPRLRPQDHAVARSPMEPLRLGPSDDAPFFMRLSTHLLVHLRDEDPGFWRANGFVRVCVPDGGCGYAPVGRVAPVSGLEDKPQAVALMRAAFGPASAELGCWPQRAVNGDGLFCLRPLRLFDHVGPAGALHVLVVGGMGFTPDGPLSRCHACPAAFGLIVAEADRVRVMPLHLLGSWGRGPSADDVSLVGGDSEGWRVAARLTYNDRGANVDRWHVFGLFKGEPVSLGALPGEVRRLEETSRGVSRELRAGYRLAWEAIAGAGVSPRLIPLAGGEPEAPIRQDPATGRYIAPDRGDEAAPGR